MEGVDFCTVPSYKRSDKTDCNNFRGIWLLSTAYKLLSITLLSRLTPYGEEITGDHQCGFWRNRSTTDHIFCIWKIRKKTRQSNEARNQIFTNFKKAYDSVRWEVLYYILKQFRILIKLVRLINICLTEIYSSVRVRRHFSEMFGRCFNATALQFCFRVCH